MIDSLTSSVNILKIDSLEISRLWKIFEHDFPNMLGIRSSETCLISVQHFYTGAGETNEEAGNQGLLWYLQCWFGQVFIEGIYRWQRRVWRGFPLLQSWSQPLLESEVAYQSAPWPRMHRWQWREGSCAKFVGSESQSQPLYSGSPGWRVVFFRDWKEVLGVLD